MDGLHDWRPILGAVSEPARWINDARQELTETDRLHAFGKKDELPTQIVGSVRRSSAGVT